MTTDLGDRYILISSDCHAGANHETYREYLDPKYVDDFDAWRGKYKNPWKDLRDTDLRVRNWDDDRRDADQLADGVVGEVIFPNTVPPFYPGFVLFAGPPKADEYEYRRAGIHAHNRWLVDFCASKPAQRAGVGQFFLNDIDDAIEDVTWIKEHGLRGGVLLPTVAPDVKWVKPLYDPEYDRLWAALQDLEIPVNLHGGTGSPNYGKYAVTPLLMISEVGFYSQRPLVQFMLSGIFERFPKLKFVVTETGASWVPPLLNQLDAIVTNVKKGEIGELKYRAEDAIAKLPSEYFAQNVWMGVSQPGPDDAAVRTLLGEDRFMWGSDYPHDEGTGPYTTLHFRQVFHDVAPEQLRKVLGENPAKLYGFDLDKLAPLAEKYGPTVDEVAKPLTMAEMPEQPNSALLKSLGQTIA